MKHYAVVHDGVVANIVVANEAIGDDYVEYTDSNPAFVGGSYEGGFFYAPQPFPSWTKSAGEWVPPVPEPAEGTFKWDESTTSWVPFTPITPSLPYPNDGQLYEWDNANGVWALV